MREERGEVVGLCRANRGIEAAFALARGDRVPKGDPVAEQHLKPRRIVLRRFAAFQEVRHEPPETILRVGVVLLRLERRRARHRAEDDVRAALVYARRKADAGEGRSGHEQDSFAVEFDESAFASYNKRRKGAAGNGQPR